MIITRSPLRVSLGGGGTDLPSYYREHGGFLVAAAIDKYVYLTQHRTFQQEIIIKYSKLERVQSVDQIEHPIVREAMKLTGVTEPHLELTSMADIPGGTGLGPEGEGEVSDPEGRIGQRAQHAGPERPEGKSVRLGRLLLPHQPDQGNRGRPDRTALRPGDRVEEAVRSLKLGESGQGNPLESGRINRQLRFRPRLRTGLRSRPRTSRRSASASASWSC